MGAGACGDRLPHFLKGFSMSRTKVKTINSENESLFEIVIDTREQTPWKFEGIRADKKDGFAIIRVNTCRGTLKSGDYSLKGYENIISIERKSLADLYGTIGQGRERFEAELERLGKNYYFAAVIVESAFDRALTDPPRHSNLNPKTVFRSIVAWQARYPRIQWIFPGNSRRDAEVYAFRLLEKIWIEIQRNSEKGTDY